MKKRILRVLSLMLAVMMLSCLLAACSDKSSEDDGEPSGIFTSKDIAAVTEGYDTVGDYIDAINPVDMYWEYDAKTSLTMFTIRNFFGWVQIKASLPAELVNETTLPQSATITKDQLSAEILSAECEVYAIQWNAPEFAEIIPFVRGIGFSSTIKDVRAAFVDKLDPDTEYGMLYDVTDINPKADDTWTKATLGGLVMNDDVYGYIAIYTWCDLKSPDDFHEYDRMVYGVNDNVEYIYYVHLDDNNE